MDFTDYTDLNPRNRRNPWRSGKDARPGPELPFPFKIKHFGANIWRLIAEIRARAAVANACYLTAARGLARIDFSAMTSCSLQKFHAGSAGVQVPFL